MDLPSLQHNIFLNYSKVLFYCWDANEIKDGYAFYSYLDFQDHQVEEELWVRLDNDFYYKVFFLNLKVIYSIQS